MTARTSARTGERVRYVPVVSGIAAPFVAPAPSARRLQQSCINSCSVPFDPNRQNVAEFLCKTKCEGSGFIGVSKGGTQSIPTALD